MALTTPLLYQSLLVSRVAGVFPFAGVAYDGMAIGLTNGIMQWLRLPANLSMTGVSTGTAGSGAIVTPISRLTVPPNVGVMIPALSGAGMNGPLSFSLATSVATGISQAFSLYGQYAGPSVGVAVGADVSKVTVSNAASLIGILNLTLRASMGPGTATSMMAQGLGSGVAALLLLGSGTAPVAGVTTAPSASVGVTTSMVV